MTFGQQATSGPQQCGLVNSALADVVNSDSPSKTDSGGSRVSVACSSPAEGLE